MTRSRRNPVGRILLAAGVLAGTPLVGCETTSTPVRPAVQITGSPPPQAKVVALPKAAEPRKLTPEDLAVTDPCAVRLHDISGQMLWFYAINHRLPGTLDELKTTADPGADVDYTCPVTHKPYGYSPQGLESQGQARRLVVYDAVPNADGKRWCVLIGDLKPAQPLATWVVQLPEIVFRTYLPAVP